MTDIEIVNKFIEKTNKGEILWVRSVKNASDPKLSVSYFCSFVPGEKIELVPTRYTDSYTLQTKYSYKMNFVDKTGFCYKSIAPLASDLEFNLLQTLFKNIETRSADLDNKLKQFFGIN